MDPDCNEKEKWADEDRPIPCFCNRGGCATCEGLEPEGLCPEPDDLDPYAHEEDQ